MNVTFQVEKLAAVAGEAQALCAAHWDETEASMYGGKEYVLDVAQYQQLEEAGILCLATARADSRLVGYASFFVTYNQHMGGMVGALDGLFMAREFRGHNSLKLMRFAVASLKVCGVAAVQFSAPASNAKVGKLYARMGAAITETVYTLRFA